uniref:Uncharacterized protein n=1 Tax=Oryza barthii TaxID=65489 RepID=A0A0D3G311_9ORYZ
MGTTTRGPVTMRLYCFYAAALFILCFLLPAALCAVGGTASAIGPFFPSHTATVASKPWALATTAFDLHDAIVDGEAGLFRVEQRRRRLRPGTG